MYILSFSGRTCVCVYVLCVCVSASASHFPLYHRIICIHGRFVGGRKAKGTSHREWQIYYVRIIIIIAGKCSGENDSLQHRCSIAAYQPYSEPVLPKCITEKPKRVNDMKMLAFINRQSCLPFDQISNNGYVTKITVFLFWLTNVK